MNGSAPPGGVLSQPPVQSPVQPMMLTTHCGLGAVEAARVLDARRDALRPADDRVAEVVRDLGLEDVAHGLAGRHGELRQHLRAEPAGRGDPFARQADVLQDAQRVGQVRGELVGRPPGRPVPVLHELRSSGPGTDGRSSRSITRVCVTISGWMSQLGTISVRTSSRLSSSSRRVQPGSPRSSRPTQAGYGTIAVLALDAVLGAPLAELAHEAVGDLDRPDPPVAQRTPCCFRRTPRRTAASRSDSGSRGRSSRR